MTAIDPRPNHRSAVDLRAFATDVAPLVPHAFVAFWLKVR